MSRGTKCRAPGGAAAALLLPRDGIAALLDQAGSSRPQARDVAFHAVRRLLAAHLAAQRLYVPRSAAGDRFALAITSSVACLECLPRESLDFSIEIGLLQEIVSDHVATFDAGARATGAVAPRGRQGCATELDEFAELDELAELDEFAEFAELDEAVAAVARQLPTDESWSFERLGEAARSSLRRVHGVEAT